LRKSASAFAGTSGSASGISGAYSKQDVPRVEEADIHIQPFILKLLLHARLSYKEEVTAILAPSMSQLVYTTWALQVCKMCCFPSL
jgi:hypothetical protein